MKVRDYKSNEDDKLAKQLEKDKDIAFTKEDMAKHLISLVDFKDWDVVIEPCYWDGAFYKNLPSYTKNIFCEINMGKDYLDFDGMADITLSNPPFVPRKLFWEFHKKAMQTTRREIYRLINMYSMNVFTPKRMCEMEEAGWYIQNFHITQDKRWFGRYVRIRFSKEKNRLFTYDSKPF